MGRIFYSDFCLCGQCIFRQQAEETVRERTAENEKERRQAKRTANELLVEMMRLMKEDGLMR